VFAVINRNTLVDKYRCYELWQLVKETASLHGAYIKVDVWKGGTGSLIAKRAMMFNIQDTIYLCDTFTGLVKSGDKDNSYVGGEHSDTSIEIVNRLLHELGIKNVSIVKGIFPEESHENTG